MVVELLILTQVLGWFYGSFICQPGLYYFGIQVDLLLHCVACLGPYGHIYSGEPNMFNFNTVLVKFGDRKILYLNHIGFGCD